MLQLELRKRIAEGVKDNLHRYGTASKMAVALGINATAMSRMMRGEIDNLISDERWLNIARRLEIKLSEDAEWHTAKTPTFEFVWSQLTACQESSLSGLLCDMADIGKTYTARAYVREHRNAVYIDCSQAKSKQALVRAISREYGIGHTGHYADVYANLVYYLRSLPNPLIILDEAGDLEYKAFLELKALWNATEYSCGWYMMGADGLKAKIEQNKAYKRVGYTEIFSRFGGRYQRITPDGTQALEEFARRQVSLVAEANGLKGENQRVFAQTQGSLRRVRIAVMKSQKSEVRSQKLEVRS